MSVQMTPRLQTENRKVAAILIGVLVLLVVVSIVTILVKHRTL